MAKANANKLTAGRNVIWESSRMMLPEHKERIVEHRESFKRKGRPEFDEQEAEELARRIGEALETGNSITLTVYGELADREETGIVVRLDALRGIVRLRTADGDVEVPFRDVTGAE